MGRVDFSWEVLPSVTARSCRICVVILLGGLLVFSFGLAASIAEDDLWSSALRRSICEKLSRFPFERRFLELPEVNSGVSRADARLKPGTALRPAVMSLGVMHVPCQTRRARMFNDLRARTRRECQNSEQSPLSSDKISTPESSSLPSNRKC